MQIESVLQTKIRSEPAKKSVFCSPALDNGSVCHKEGLHEIYEIYVG